MNTFCIVNDVQYIYKLETLIRTKSTQFSPSPLSKQESDTTEDWPLGHKIKEFSLKSPKVGWIMHVIRFILSFNFFIKFCIAIRFCSSYCCMLIRNQKIFFEHFLKNFLAHRVLFRHWLQQFTEIGRAKKPCRPCMQMKTGRI